MNAIVISYSLTGNNNSLALRIADALKAEHLSISESKPRNMLTIVLDLMFNRTPKVQPDADKLKGYELVVLVGPVWMGQVATPLRSFLHHIKMSQAQFAFISISGGADGANPKLALDLYKRAGKDPVALVDLHIADLLPPVPKPTRKDTSAYRLKENDVMHLTDRAVKTLRESMDRVK